MMETEVIIIPKAHSSIQSELQDIANEIVSRLDAVRQMKRDEEGPRDRSDRNYASEIGHPCLKYLVHARLDWDKRKPRDISSEYRLEEGNEREWQIQKKLGDIGLILEQSQSYFNIEELKLRGKIDGILTLPRPVMGYRRAPAEIKSIAPQWWDRINSVEDLRNHRKWWFRKYVSQLNTYLIAGDYPFGFFILDTFGKRPKILPMLRDEELWAHDSARIQKVNEYCDRGEYPEPIPYDPSICGMCDFAHICQPLKATEFTEIPASEEEVLKEFLWLREYHEKYEEMKKTLIGDKNKPGRFWGINAVVGSIVIETKVQQRTTYEIPDEVKAPYAKKQEVVITSIKRIDE